MLGKSIALQSFRVILDVDSGKAFDSVDSFTEGLRNVVCVSWHPLMLLMQQEL